MQICCRSGSLLHMPYAECVSQALHASVISEQSLKVHQYADDFSLPCMACNVH